MSLLTTTQLKNTSRWSHNIDLLTNPIRLITTNHSYNIMCQPTISSPLPAASAVPPNPLVQKSVRFGETQERFLDPLPYFCKDSLYYTSKELKLNKKEHGFFRGLEHANHSVERRRHIQDFVQTVLDVQREQQEYGLDDEYELFMVATIHSKKDRIRAQRMGAQDHVEATTEEEEEEKGRKRSKGIVKKVLSGSYSKLRSSSKNLLKGSSLKELSFKSLSFRIRPHVSAAC